MTILTVIQVGMWCAAAYIYYHLQKNIPNKKACVLGGVMLELFVLSTLGLLYPENEVGNWLRHIPFYMGQIVFYFFLRRIITVYENVGGESEDSLAPPKEFTHQIVGTWGWASFLTQQGLQHILTVPLFFLVLTTVQIYKGIVRSPYLKSCLHLLLIASCFLTMIHIQEFVVHSQHWITFIHHEVLQYLELFWFGSALLSMYFAIDILGKGIKRSVSPV